MNLLTSFRLHNRKRLCALSLSLDKRDSFLDLGCGESGDLLTHALASQCDPILAIDVDKAKLVRSRVRSGCRVHLIRASGTYLPLRDEIFSKIAMVEVIEHLPKGTEVRSLQEIRRVLKTKGRLFLSTPNKRLLFMMLDPALLLSGHRHYSSRELSARIRASGLGIVDMKTYGGMREAILTPIFYVLRKAGLCGHEMPRTMLRAVEREYLVPARSGYTLTADCGR